MKDSRISRRDILIGSSALAAGSAFSTKVMSAAPPASAITPQLIEAAKKEGKVVFYTAMDLQFAERLGKAFEAKFPGIKIHDTRMIRLMEVLLHGGTTVGGWTAKQIHNAILTSFQLTTARYGLNQLRYDLTAQELKAHFRSWLVAPV